MFNREPAAEGGRGQEGGITLADFMRYVFCFCVVDVPARQKEGIRDLEYIQI